MDLDDLPKKMRFVFIMLMQGAISVKEDGHDEKMFIEFATAVWGTLEMNDIETVKKTIIGYMLKDLENFDGDLVKKAAQELKNKMDKINEQ